MKTLIDMPRFVWGKVKDFATVKDLTISSAVEQLLIQALNSHGYTLTEMK
jgi:macrodomain Ter protein organizer (MatP/YcbG family)